MVPGSPSGQQAYRSNVLLHTSPAVESTSVKHVLTARCRSHSHFTSHELTLGGEGLTCGGGRGVEVVQALVPVAAPLLFHKLQGVSRGNLQEDNTA